MQDLIGRTLGHYRIVEKIGEGGMGEVYRARDERLDRDVAIKVLPEEVSNTRDRVRRFEREARAVAKLDHPNILTIHDFGTDQSVTYAVMELLEGKSLRELIFAGELNTERTLQYAQEIADGLAAAHDRGIIHRDLKPENIFLTRSGRIKILDFGLAKLGGRDEDRAAATQTPTETLFTVPGTVMGTVAYMSPEQVHGELADARSDIFSLGVVLYEMLTGQRPFQGATSAATSAAILHNDPPPLEEIGFSAPQALTTIVQRCLNKKPVERYLSAHELGEALRACPLTRGTSFRGLTLRQVGWRRWPLYLGLGSVVIAGTLVAATQFRQRERIRWAQNEALPQIADLVANEEYIAAFDLAEEAEPYLSSNPIMVRLWGEMARYVSLNTEPPGASVEFREYGHPESRWRHLGRTPLQTARIPYGFFVWRITRDACDGVEMASSGVVFPLADDRGTIPLLDAGAAPPGMVRVAGGEHRLDLPAHLGQPAVVMDDYFIDRFEVTNRDFKPFANTAYEDSRYWAEPFLDGGGELTWREAMDRFRDASGLHGPATWEAGSCPGGKEDFPVTGVSWVEAAAYCGSVGKVLPTVYHWDKASGSTFAARIVPESNLNGSELAKVGQFQGVGPYGTYDMAGNAREWVWNASGLRRYILGGAWDDRAAMFREPDLRSPFERSPTFGFRCMKPLDTAPLPSKLYEEIVPVPSTLEAAEVSDVEYEVIERLYRYDETPLNATIEMRDSSPEDWTKEIISVDAAYGGERLSLLIFLPKRRNPPFLPVVFFPGSWAMQALSSKQISTKEFDFVMRSGRALCYPIYKGTYERGIGRQDDNPDDTSSYRDLMIMLSKDLGRAIDYLESRPQDFNSDNAAYLGYSWGAALGAILPALEPRLRVVVLDSGGYFQQLALPEADQRTFAPRVHVPVLMINGCYDSFFPVDSSQVPMFEDFGTPRTDKLHLIEPAGHTVPRPTRIRATLEWLDRYQGEVQ